MSSNLQTTLGVSAPPPDNKWLSTFYASLNRLWQQLALIINGQISFGDGVSKGNIDGVWASALSVAGNFVVTHNLGRKPVGWIMVNTNAFENLKFAASSTATLTLTGQLGGATLLLFIF